LQPAIKNLIQRKSPRIFRKDQRICDPFADKKVQFFIEKMPLATLWAIKMGFMEVFNTNNCHGVFSIPRLKPGALKTPGSLLIHYV